MPNIVFKPKKMDNGTPSDLIMTADSVDVTSSNTSIPNNVSDLQDLIDNLGDGAFGGGSDIDDTALSDSTTKTYSVSKIYDVLGDAVDDAIDDANCVRYDTAYTNQNQIPVVSEIDDTAATSSTTKTYSANKITSNINTAVSAATDDCIRYDTDDSDDTELTTAVSEINDGTTSATTTWSSTKILAILNEIAPLIGKASFNPTTGEFVDE